MSIAKLSRVSHWENSDTKSRAKLLFNDADAPVGYRVYYALAGRQVVMLLCGGDKTTQDADIETAIEYWEDWKARQQDDLKKTK